MRISNKVREEAALICALAASAGHQATYDMEIAQHLGLWRGTVAATCGVPSVKLALAAWSHVFNADQSQWTSETDAEAEAMLRTGWVP